jgi:hypothetical protein
MVEKEQWWLAGFKLRATEGSPVNAYGRSAYRPVER